MPQPPPSLGRRQMPRVRCPVCSAPAALALAAAPELARLAPSCEAVLPTACPGRCIVAAHSTLPRMSL